MTRQFCWQVTQSDQTALLGSSAAYPPGACLAEEKKEEAALTCPKHLKK